MTQAHSSQEKVEQAKQTIATMLVLDHEGKGNEIQGTKVAEAVGLEPTTVYDIIPRIRRQYRIPVVANSNGYFVIQDRDVFADHIQAIESEIETKEQRKQELQSAFNG